MVHTMCAKIATLDMISSVTYYLELHIAISLIIDVFLSSKVFDVL